LLKTSFRIKELQNNSYELKKEMKVLRIRDIFKIELFPNSHLSFINRSLKRNFSANRVLKTKAL